jgi:hypothetical protein
MGFFIENQIKFKETLDLAGWVEKGASDLLVAQANKARKAWRP